jgi:hypothetical protein
MTMVAKIKTCSPTNPSGEDGARSRTTLPPWAEEASYFDGDLLPEHKKNPLISCLGPYLSDAEYALRLASPVPYNDHEKSYSREWRMHAISRLQNLVVVRGPNITLASDLHRLIRSHYGEVDIRDNGLLDFQDPFAVDNEGRLVNTCSGRQTHAYCKGIFGLSGTGKTTAVMTALGLWKQVRYHPAYSVAQVVWLKVDCPRSHSLKDVLKTILAAYDKLLGKNRTPYLAELSSKATIADYANKVARVARKHFTGMIVLDEVQFAIDAMSGKDSLLDFFVYFSNIVEVPLTFCGTPRAEAMFKKTLYLARRVASGGEQRWMRSTNLEDWSRICKYVGKYQWLKDSAPIDDKLQEHLLFITAGVLGILIPLFQLVQYRAIRYATSSETNGAARKERITKELVSDVFHDEMSILGPIVEAIRAENNEHVAGFEDVLEASLGKVKKTLTKSTAEHALYDALLESDRLEAATDAVSRLRAIDVPQERAFELVSEAQEKCPDATAMQLFEEVAKAMLSRLHGGRNGATAKRPTRPPRVSNIV